MVFSLHHHQVDELVKKVLYLLVDHFVEQSTNPYRDGSEDGGSDDNTKCPTISVDDHLPGPVHPLLHLIQLNIAGIDIDGVGPPGSNSPTRLILLP